MVVICEAPAVKPAAMMAARGIGKVAGVNYLGRRAQGNCRQPRDTGPAACSAFQGRAQGRTLASRSATIFSVTRA